MIKELVHDPMFLGQKSETATIMDLQTAKDLLDTLTAHKDTCVGIKGFRITDFVAGLGFAGHNSIAVFAVYTVVVYKIITAAFTRLKFDFSHKHLRHIKANYIVHRYYNRNKNQT